MNHFYQNLPGMCTYASFYAWAAQKMPLVGAHCVELGVAWGQGVAALAVELKNRGCVDAKIDMVDLGPKSNVEANLAPVADMLGVYHQENSWEAARHYSDASLDLVFIDANHSRKCVEDDIRAWRTEVKCGGILAGHDHTPEGSLVGVIEAVMESFAHYRVWRGETYQDRGLYYPVWWTFMDGKGGEVIE